MTIIELSKLLASAISQGRGQCEVRLFQWGYGSQALDAVETRPDGTAELYSNTRQECGSASAPVPCQSDNTDPTENLFDDEDLI